jgi:hypothetical protein
VVIGILKLKLHLPGCASLKEKRGRLKPLLARLHREFNVSAAETAHHDLWQSAEISCALIGAESRNVEARLAAIPGWLETHWQDLPLEAYETEILA